MMVKVKFELKGFKELRRRLAMTEKEINRANAMALNKTAAKAKVEMKRAISSEFSIPQKSVIKRLLVFKAKRTNTGLTASLVGYGRRFNVINFLEKKPGIRELKRRHREEGNRPQLRFKIKKNGPAKTIRGAFIGNRGRTVFRRIGKGRLPIRPVQTIGIPGMFNTRRINKRVIAHIRKELPIEVDRAIDQVIRKRFKR